MNAILTIDKRAANNSQQAIALAAGELLRKRTFLSRLMIEMPPGTGKSVVIALLVGLLAGWVETTTIVYNDPDLLEFERETINRIVQSLGKVKIKLMSVRDINETNEQHHPILDLDPEGLTIVDEADDVFLGKMLQLRGNGALVCLTATIPGQVAEPQLFSYIHSTLKFSLLFSGMETNFEEADLVDVTYKEYFAVTTDMAKLVYCNEEDVEKVRAAAKE